MHDHQTEVLDESSSFHTRPGSRSGGQTEVLVVRGTHRAKAAGTKREVYAIIAWAWRSLYAEIVKAHIENTKPNFERAYFHTVRYTISRVQAYGLKWRRWYIRQAHWVNGKIFPEKHREHLLVTMTQEAEFALNPKLVDNFTTARQGLY